MKVWTRASKLVASALMVCIASSAVAEEAEKSTLDEIKAAIEELKKIKSTQPQNTVNSQTLAIESWLLSSTAIDATATRIRSGVGPRKEKVIVLAGDEALDANQVAMLRTEMDSLSNRIAQASNMRCGTRTGPFLASTITPSGAIAAAAAIADLLKTETELTAISQTVDATLLAAAVAGKFEGQAIIPSAAIAAGTQGRVIPQFKDLVEQAEIAQLMHNDLAAKKDPTDCEKQKLGRLAAPLARFDTFYTRVTTAGEKGAIPIVVADRLDQILGENTVVLRVDTESSGGTLLKRKNLVTAFGGETAFISGGLVSSYQLTRPTTGELLKSGVVTCRTTLTSLKRVQNGSWSSPTRLAPGDRRSQPLAVCFESKSG